jgi:type VI secretion system (T6SS) effector Tae4 (amidase)
MGVALGRSGLNLSSFHGARCYSGLRHHRAHILRAQELANWLREQKIAVGRRKIYSHVTSQNFLDKKGIVFIKNGWGPTDHIDIWDGKQMKGGSPAYFALGQEVWFWELS